MQIIPMLLALVSALVPTKTWYAPSAPLTINVKSEGESRLVLTDFNGTNLDAKVPAEAVVNGEKTVDLKGVFAQVSTPGTYVLYVVPKGKPADQFTGTPLVIEARSEQRRGAPVLEVVTKVIPLEYAIMTTDKGPMTLMFYYDVAPITVESFLNLSRTDYYDGLIFHRIVPNFVIQGGDPRGDGQGGPGYNLQAEFNDRKHEPGVLSMARASDPNSAGSQFFICLDYTNTQQLDHKYTAFGKVVAGMDTVKAIAAVPVAGAEGRPKDPPTIQKVEVKPVTAAENPYAGILLKKK